MKRTGSARKLMDTIQKLTISKNYVDLTAALEELVDGQKQVSGSDVATALGGLYKHHGRWVWVRQGFDRVLQWIKPTVSSDANQGHHR